jgi:hypothetical protein
VGAVNYIGGFSNKSEKSQASAIDIQRFLHIVKLEHILFGLILRLRSYFSLHKPDLNKEMQSKLKSLKKSGQKKSKL